MTSRRRNRKKVLDDQHDKLVFHTEPKWQGYIARMVELILQGWRSNELYADLVEHEPEVTERMFEHALLMSYDQVRVSLHRDREYVFQLHMDRYERVYKEGIVMEDWDGNPLNPRKHWTIMLGKYREAMAALKAKEQLLGLHDKNVVIDITTTSATVIDDGTSKHNNLSKLTLPEKVELLHLLQQTRAVPLEGVRQVVLKKTIIQVTEHGRESLQQQTIIRPGEVIEDIKYEEMPAKVIDQVKDVSEESEEEQLHQAPIIEDCTGGAGGSRRNAQQIQDMIQSDLKAKFERLMRRVKPKV